MNPWWQMVIGRVWLQLMGFWLIALRLVKAIALTACCQTRCVRGDDFVNALKLVVLLAGFGSQIDEYVTGVGRAVPAPNENGDSIVSFGAKDGVG